MSMGWRETIHRLKRVAGRPTDQQIDDELRHHLELLVEENVRAGMSAEAARTAARKSFGGVEQTKEACRDVLAIAWLQTCRRDVAYALRQLRRSPVFTLTAVVTLALGIGASTAMFSVVNGVLLKPLPYEEADRLAVLRSVNQEKGLQTEAVSSLDAADWQQTCESFDGIGLYGWSEVDLPQDHGAMRVQGLSVTPEFFRVLTLEPSMGRVFSDEEFESRADVILLSSRLWRRRYGGDPEIVGRTIDVRSWRAYPEVGAKPYQVVGIIDTDSRFLPTTSGFESRPVGVDQRVDFWLPLQMRDELEHREYRYNIRAIARLRSGVSREQAQQELHRVCGHLATDYPETNEGWTAEVVPLEETIVGDVRSTIWLLLGAIGFLLLVALANVASLLLVRGVRRQHELAVRAALGADRGRLIGQLVTESLVLGLVSGGVGVGVAFGGVALLKRLAPPQLPRVEDVTIDGTVLATAVLVSTATGLLVGMIPAWLASRVDSGAALNVSGRTRSTGRSSRLALKSLAAGSVAIALVLLIGAGLLQQSLARVLGTELGFKRERLLTMQLSLPLAAHEWNWNTSFCHEVVEHVGTVSGVESVGAIRGLPTQETDFSIQFIVEGSPEVPDSDRPKGMIRVIGPGYFETTGIPLISGRLFVPRRRRRRDRSHKSHRRQSGGSRSVLAGGLGHWQTLERNQRRAGLDGSGWRRGGRPLRQPDGARRTRGLFSGRPVSADDVSLVGPHDARPATGRAGGRACRSPNRAGRAGHQGPDDGWRRVGLRRRPSIRGRAADGVLRGRFRNRRRRQLRGCRLPGGRAEARTGDPFGPRCRAASHLVDGPA